MRSLARSIPALALALVTGCALTIQPPDPDRPRGELPKCDSGKGAVGLDVVMTAILGLGSIAALADGEEGTGLALGAIGGLFAASAVRGNTAASECRAAYGEYAATYHQMREAPIVRPPPRPVTARKPPTPAVVPPVEEPVVQPSEPAEPTASAPTVPRPETYGTPRPAPRPAEPKKQPAKSELDGEDWSSFWKEAP